MAEGQGRGVDPSWLRGADPPASMDALNPYRWHLHHFLNTPSSPLVASLSVSEPVHACPNAVPVALVPSGLS